MYCLSMKCVALSHVNKLAKKIDVEMKTFEFNGYHKKIKIGKRKLELISMVCYIQC